VSFLLRRNLGSMTHTYVEGRDSSQARGSPHPRPILLIPLIPLIPLKGHETQQPMASSPTTAFPDLPLAVATPAPTAVGRVPSGWPGTRLRV
jgi:hypothetical protein